MQIAKIRNLVLKKDFKKRKLKKKTLLKKKRPRPRPRPRPRVRVLLTPFSIRPFVFVFSREFSHRDKLLTSFWIYLSVFWINLNCIVTILDIFGHFVFMLSGEVINLDYKKAHRSSWFLKKKGRLLAEGFGSYNVPVHRTEGGGHLVMTKFMINNRTDA